MQEKIRLHAASVSAIQAAIGNSLRAQIEAWGKISDFVVASNVGRTTLYRLFAGETVGDDVLINVYRALGRFDVLTALTEPPQENPLQFVTKPKAKGITPSKAPLSVTIEGVAIPRGRGNKP